MMDRNNYLYIFDTYLLIAIEIIVGVSMSIPPNCRHFTRDLQLEQQETKGFFVFEIKSDSIFNCSSTCLQNDLCVVFTYDETKGDCTGFHSYATVSDTSSNVHTFSGQIFHTGDNRVYTTYGKVSFLLLDIEGTTEEARQLCLDYGGRLPIIDTEEKFNDTMAIAGEFPGFLLGLSDVEVEGTYIWDNGEELTMFSNMYSEFNNKDVQFKGFEEYYNADCSTFRPKTSTIADINCKRSQTIVCEKNP